MPAVIAIDCEMCETTDPVTGVKCDNALIRFSAVDATGVSSQYLNSCGSSNTTSENNYEIVI